MKQVKLVVQAGHNPPEDPGAVYGGVVEALENRKLEARVHLAVYQLAADDDMDVEIKAFRGSIAWKAAQINLYNPVCAVELHHNAASSVKARGHETIYSLHPDSADLAKDIDHYLDLALPNHDRGIKVGWFRQDPSRGLVGLFRRVHRPCVIPEPLFITNRDDRDILRDETKMNEIALAIARGIMAFVKRKLGW